MIFLEVTLPFSSTLINIVEALLSTYWALLLCSGTVFQLRYHQNIYTRNGWVRKPEYHSFYCAVLMIFTVTSTGLKLELIGPIQVRRGVLLLKPSNVRILGGHVSEFDKVCSLAQQLTNKLGPDNVKVLLAQAGLPQLPPPSDLPGGGRGEADGLFADDEDDLFNAIEIPPTASSVWVDFPLSRTSFLNSKAVRVHWGKWRANAKTQMKMFQWLQDAWLEKIRGDPGVKQTVKLVRRLRVQISPLARYLAVNFFEENCHSFLFAVLLVQICLSCINDL